MRTILMGLIVLGAAAAFAEEKSKPPARKTGLALEVRLEKGVESGVAFELTGAFVNRGEKAVSFFVPEHVKLEKFPLFVFTDKDGQRWRPYNEPFGSKRGVGLRGEVAELAPGAERAFTYRVAKFVRIQDPRSQRWNSPVPLRAGTYTVSAVYEQTTNELRHGVRDAVSGRIASEKRRHEGLWTGKIASKTLTIDVAPPRTTTLTIDGPYELQPGKPYMLQLELRNGGDKPFVFDGTIRVIGSSKAYGSGTIELRPPGYEEGKPVTIGAGKQLVWAVDLGKLDFEPGLRAKRRNAASAPLASILHRRGVFLLQARIGGAEHPPEVASNELWRLRTAAR